MKPATLAALVSTILIINIIISSASETDITGSVTVIARPTATLPPSSSDTTSSSGSSGVVTNEPISNIIGSSSLVLDLSSDNPRNYIFDKTNIGINIITLISKRNESNIMVRAELLKGQSKTTTGLPAGIVNKFFNIWVESQQIASGLITFKIDDQWIADNNIESIFVFRFVNNGWQKLDTVQIGRDGAYTHFEAKTGGFSSFVITGNPVATTTTTINAPTPEVTPETTLTKPDVSVVSVTASQKPELNLLYGTVLVVVLMALAGTLLYWYFKIRKGE